MADTHIPPSQINGATLPVTSTENVGTKRHRRPSVRLGDIGEPQYDSHPNRRTKQWNPSKSSKTRLLKLPGGALDEQHKDDLHNSNLIETVAIGSWKVKKDPNKSRTLPTNVRSTWVSKVDEDGFRDFDQEASDDDSPVQPHHDTDDDDTDGTGNFNNLERGGVRAWLKELGLGRYAPVFEIHEVDDQVLHMLTLEDLKDMGINAVGARRKMYSSILKMGEEFS